MSKSNSLKDGTKVEKSMVSEEDMALFTTIKEESTVEIGKTIRCMAKAPSTIQMEGSPIKVNGTMTT